MILAMPRIMLAALAFAAAVPAVAADRRYTVTDFDRIVVEGPFSVKLTTGRAPSASATGSSEALERVSVEVQGRTLRIRPNRSAWGGYPGEGRSGADIIVSTHELRQAQLLGSGSLSIDRAKGLRFDAALSGSGRLAIGAVEADNLILGVVGAGRMEIAGKAKTMRLTVQGAAGVDGGALIVEDADVNAATSGDVVVGARRSAKVSASGPGNVAIIGSPACTVTATGAGLVSCGD